MDRSSRRQTQHLQMGPKLRPTGEEGREAGGGKARRAQAGGQEARRSRSTLEVASVIQRARSQALNPPPSTLNSSSAADSHPPPDASPRPPPCRPGTSAPS